MTTASLTDSALARIRPDIRAMHAYVVQNSDGLLKMDAMENPFSLPPELQAELGQRLGALALNRYPGDGPERLKAALAQHIGLPAGQALVLGNGSDELISLLALACALPLPDGQRAKVLAPIPGFVMYAMSAQLQGLDFVGVPLLPDFALDEAAMLASIATHRPALTFIAYPNNPTATLWDEAVVQRIAEAVGAQGGILVMDEAYQPFASRTFIDRMRAEPARNAHVLLMRTLSKFGLAGVRLGYLIGPAALVAEIDKVRSMTGPTKNRIPGSVTGAMTIRPMTTASMWPTTGSTRRRNTKTMTRSASTGPSTGRTLTTPATAGRRARGSEPDRVCCP